MNGLRAATAHHATTHAAGMPTTTHAPGMPASERAEPATRARRDRFS
jgi:hypothetical protein